MRSCSISQPDEALQSYRRALELAEGELAINPSHAVNQAQTAYYSARLHDRDRARQRIAIASFKEDEFLYSAQIGKNAPDDPIVILE